MADFSDNFVETAFSMYNVLSKTEGLEFANGYVRDFVDGCEGILETSDSFLEVLEDSEDRLAYISSMYENGVSCL